MKRMSRILLAITVAVSFLAHPVAQTPTASQPRVFTVEDLWAIGRVGLPEVSPDGTMVAYTVTRYDMEENRGNADLYVVPISGGEPRRITTHKASDTAPAWSPDNRRLAFVSKRDDDRAAQIYVIALDGGEAERVTDMPLGVSDAQWFPDGRRLAFVSHVIAGAESPADTKKALDAREKQKVKAHTTDNRLFRYWDRWLTDDEYPHLFTVDLATKAVVDLLPGSRRFFGLQSGSGSYDIAPDGRTIAFEANSTEPPFRTLNTDIFVVGAEGGAIRNLTASNAASDSSPLFSPDGRSIAYGTSRKADDWPDYTRVAVIDVASGASRMLTDGWDNSTAGWQWTPDGGSLVFEAAVRARTSLYTVPLAGGTPRELVQGGAARGVQVAKDALVYQLQSLTQPAELMAASLDGRNARRLTRVNDALMSRIRLGEVQESTFKGAGNDDVQMFVVRPPGFDRARKYPLVHLVHGGPVGTFSDEFHMRWNAQLFAAQGYIVAMVNFHGSSSFGQPFVESILGAHPDKPLEDIMKATDILIDVGSVDPARMAAAGGSYGGFLVNWIAGHTNRFKALVSHAGVYSLPGQFASDDTFGRQHSYGGYPFTGMANVERWSPNRFADAFGTPMLVTHGERDYRVPYTQGLELYGVLTAKGVPARLVVYPDENHWILKPQNSRHWHGEVFSWLERYLGAGRKGS